MFALAISKPLTVALLSMGLLPGAVVVEEAPRRHLVEYVVSRPEFVEYVSDRYYGPAYYRDRYVTERFYEGRSRWYADHLWERDRECGFRMDCRTNWESRHQNDWRREERREEGRREERREGRQEGRREERRAEDRGARREERREEHNRTPGNPAHQTPTGHTNPNHGAGQGGHNHKR